MDGGKRPGVRRWLSAARHPCRRDGAAVALLVLPWAVALALVLGRHQLDHFAGIVVGFCVGLPGLWLA